MKTPITKEKFKTHLTYSAWKYFVLCIGSIFVWSMVYAQTAYRSPQDKRIDVYIKSSTVTEDLMNAYFEPIWKETVPDMEIITGVTLMDSTGEDYYSQMQLTVYVAAGEGDIYILPSADYKMLAATGAFVDLQPLIDQGKINVEGIDLKRGVVSIVDDETGVVSNGLYGIPMDSLYGYMDGMQLDNRDKVMAILYNNQNDENVVPFFDALIQSGRKEKPEWLNETQSKE